MIKTAEEIEERLSGIKFRELSMYEREMVWQRIASAIKPQPIPSPWLLPVKFKTKIMIPLIIVAIMFAGAGGTAVLADNSRPGDALFPIDRASEKVRLAFANENKSVELKARFAEERLGEVEGLIAMFRVASSTSSVNVIATSTINRSATSTSTTTPPRKNNDRVALGVNVALAYLNEVSADLAASGNVEAQARIEAVITRLEQLINTDDIRVKLKNDGDFQLRLKGEDGDRIKVKTEGKKDHIQIREDGNRIHIQIREDHEDDEDENDDENEDREDDDNDDEDEDDDDNEVEVKVRGGLNIGR